MLIDRGMFGTKPESAPLSGDVCDQYAAPLVDKAFEEQLNY